MKTKTPVQEEAHLVGSSTSQNVREGNFLHGCQQLLDICDEWRLASRRRMLGGGENQQNVVYNDIRIQAMAFSGGDGLALCRLEMARFVSHHGHDLVDLRPRANEMTSSVHSGGSRANDGAIYSLNCDDQITTLLNKYLHNNLTISPLDLTQHIAMADRFRDDFMSIRVSTSKDDKGIVGRPRVLEGRKGNVQLKGKNPLGRYAARKQQITKRVCHRRVEETDKYLSVMGKAGITVRKERRPQTAVRW